MYGFIHCCLEDMVVNKFGEAAWKEILNISGVKLRGASFLIHQVYEDEMTFKLVEAASRVSGLSVEVCLEAFGEHFLLYCQKNGFDQILRVLGSNLYDFLTNLDNLHDHLASIYPGMRAPSFRVTTGWAPNGGQIKSHQHQQLQQQQQQQPSTDLDIENNNSCIMYLHYYSERKGLSPIVRGLVKAVAIKFFDTPIEISKWAGARDDHVILKIQQKRPIERSTRPCPKSNEQQPDNNNNNDQRQSMQQQQSTINVPEVDQCKSTKTDDVNNHEHNEEQQNTATTPDGASKRMMITQYHNISMRPDDLLIDCETLIDSFPFHVIFDSQFTIVQAGKTLVKMTSQFWRQRQQQQQQQKVKFYDLLSIVRPKIDRESFESIVDHANQVFVCKTRPRTLNTDIQLMSGDYNVTSNALIDDGDDFDDVVHHQHVAICPITGQVGKLPQCPNNNNSNNNGNNGNNKNNETEKSTKSANLPSLRLRLKGQMIMLGANSQQQQQFCLYLCSPRVEHLEQLVNYGLHLSDVAPHDRARDLMLMSHAHAGGRELVKQLDKTSNDLRQMDAKLRLENERTNEILRNIFPAKIANMLSEGLKVESESFSEVTCLFSDIVGFTKMCGATNVRPIDIVRLLNGLYLDFDNLTNVHGVYKVETIGDAYVVVGGLPEPVRDHADRCVRMALDMVRVIENVRSPADQQPIQMRIGIHTGPVMAGIVGMRVPRYSLFGNTTSIANRLESTGCGGKIHISMETYRKLIDKSSYIFEHNIRISENQLNLERTYFIIGTRNSDIEKPRENTNPTLDSCPLESDTR